jgi:hypothetical protein
MIPYDFTHLRRVRPGGITLADGYQLRPWEEVAQGRMATVGEVRRRFRSLIAGQRHASRTHREDADDACSSLSARNISTLDVPPSTTPISGEAATPHAPLSPPQGRAGRHLAPRCQGIPARMHRAGFRSWPPWAVLPNRGTHNILPHHIRMKAMQLKNFQISQPCERLS